MNPLERLHEYAPALRARMREKLEADLGAFCRRAWREIEPKPLEWGWHHELICEYLQLCYDRQIRRLIITVPPRGLKSRLVNVFFPAWCWVKDPSLSFVTTSYSDSLSEELSVVRRNLLTSAWFRQMWPGKVVFAQDQNRREQYQNLARGQMISTSMTGTMLGKGCDFLVCDDALSPQQSYSDLERESVNRNFDSTFRSRLNEPERGVIICISQRLHERDLPGYLLENEPNTWTHLNLPMEAEQDEQVLFPISGKVMERKQGDLLHPARFPVKWCEKQKRTIGSYLWSSQYQQRPGPLGGAIFRREWFQSFDVPPSKGQIVISLDTAYSIKKTADYSAATVWLAHEGKFYLLFVWRERCEYPRLKAMTEELFQSWNPDVVLVEERGSGQSLLQSLKEETSLPVRGISVDIDKVSRAHGITSLYESGRVYHPRSAPWLANFLHEMELFPASAHDDMVDSAVMALTYLRGQQYGGGLGLIEAMKSFFSGKRKLPPSVSELIAAKPAPSQPVQASSKPKEERFVCPNPQCKSTATVRLGAPNTIHCNQCRCDFTPGGDILNMPATENPNHTHVWREIPGHQRKCDDCGRQEWLGPEPAPAVNGLTRAQYQSGSYRRRRVG